VKWRWKTVLVAALAAGLVADILMDFLIAKRL
jgi:hypothetical protein